MEVKFGIYDTPQPKNRKGGKLTHARLHSKGTKQIDEITSFINEVSSLSPSDIKGVLEALFQYFSFNLRDGYNVELEGLGHFSVSLDSRLIKEENGKRKMRVRIDGVNFRCSPRLKKAISQTSLKKEKRQTPTLPALEIRKDRMIAYIEKHGAINASEYRWINSCSHYRATLDLKQFIEEGVILRSGRSTHKVYLLPEEG